MRVHGLVLSLQQFCRASDVIPFGLEEARTLWHKENYPKLEELRALLPRFHTAPPSCCASVRQVDLILVPSSSNILGIGKVRGEMPGSLLFFKET